MTDIARPVSAAALTGTSAAPGESWWRVVARNAFPFIVVLGLWEIVAHLGMFPPRLFPPLEEVAAAFVRLTVKGILPHHVFDTLLRIWHTLWRRDRNVTVLVLDPPPGSCRA